MLRSRRGADGRTLYLSLPPYAVRALRDPEPLAAVEGRFDTELPGPDPDGLVDDDVASLFPRILCVIEAGEFALERGYGFDMPVCGLVAFAPALEVAGAGAFGLVAACPGMAGGVDGGGVRIPLGKLPLGELPTALWFPEPGACTVMRSAPHFKQYLAVSW